MNAQNPTDVGTRVTYYNVTGTLIAQIGVIEKHIHFNSHPGSNGEKDFYNVMKKMLPDASGNVLSSSFQTGDYFITQGSWKLANVYDITQLSAVGFIQNNADKGIQQGANSSTTPLTMPYNNDVQPMTVTNYSTTNCSGSVAPAVTIRNNGNHTVTSMTIKYFVNSGTPATYTWNGNLATLKETVISLPAYTFTIYDAGGNGLCCANGQGIYQLTTPTGTIIKLGGSFGSSEFSELKMDWPTAVAQIEKNSMKVYPNPFNGEAKVTFYLLNPEDVVLDLYNSTGQLVRSINKGSFPAGDQECTLDAGNLPTGIYMLKMQAGAQVHICKVSVNK
jgi:hypothetical protein